MSQARTLRQTALSATDRILHSRVNLLLNRALFRPACSHALPHNDLAATFTLALQTLCLIGSHTPNDGASHVYILDFARVYGM
jgi:hypothetical protein